MINIFENIIITSIILFSTINIIDSLNIIMNIKIKEKNTEITKIIIFAFIISILFLLFGDIILDYVGINLKSFYISAATVLLIIGLESILGIKINRTSNKDNIIIPLLFPLIIAPGELITILLLKYNYGIYITIISLILNMLIINYIIKYPEITFKILGEVGIDVLKKIFGIIIIIISIKIFNITSYIK